MSLDELKENRRQLRADLKKENRKWKKNRDLKKIDKLEREILDLRVRIETIEKNLPSWVARVYRRRVFRRKFGPRILTSWDFDRLIKKQKKQNAPKRVIEYLKFLRKKEGSHLNHWTGT